jgi:hypothetical protein
MWAFAPAIAAAMSDPDDAENQRNMLDSIEEKFYFHQNGKGNPPPTLRSSELYTNEGVCGELLDEAEQYNAEVVDLSAHRMGRGLKRRRLSDMSWGKSIRSKMHAAILSAVAAAAAAAAAAACNPSAYTLLCPFALYSSSIHPLLVLYSLFILY